MFAAEAKMADLGTKSKESILAKRTRSMTLLTSLAGLQTQVLSKVNPMKLDAALRIQPNFPVKAGQLVDF